MDPGDRKKQGIDGRNNPRWTLSRDCLSRSLSRIIRFDSSNVIFLDIIVLIFDYILDLISRCVYDIFGSGFFKG